MSLTHTPLSQEVLLNLLRHSKEAAVVYTDRGLNIGYINHSMLALWHKQDTIVGHPLTNVAPEFIPFVPLLEQVWDTGEAYVAKDTPANIDMEGILTQRYFDFEYRPILGEDGRTCAIINSATDVTERMAALAELVESERRFRLMAEDTEVMIAIADANGAANYFNKAWSINTGRSNGELLKFGWTDLMHPDDKTGVMKIFMDALYAQRAWEWEFRMPHHAGQYRWFLAKGTPRFLDDGTFAGYISSTIDISDRKQEEQRKADFIAMVSHELRTPLTSLYGFVQLLERRAQKKDDLHTLQALQKCNGQIKRMEMLINGFLDVSRLEAGALVLTEDQFDMAELLRETTGEMNFIFPSHVLKLSGTEVAMVNADRGKMAIVLSNLITNAVKYSPKGSEILVDCQCTDQHVQVSVADCGIGIRSEHIDQLFNKYFRVAEQVTNNPAGFGVGLYLSAEIIRLHGGKIWAESSYNQGSTFYFTLGQG